MRPRALVAGPETEQASRRRHPSMRAGATAGQLAGRLADTLALTGVPNPEVAATLLSLRGRAGLDPETFAMWAGVAVGVLTEAEAGRLARNELPVVLRRLIPHPPRG